MLHSKATSLRSVRVAIVGAGLGGLGLGVKLRRAGFDDFVIFEQSDGPGGTWWDNRYPGAACDVPSHLYSYSFEPWDWSATHADQTEILAYVEHVIDKYGLRAHIRFGTRVEDVTWAEPGYVVRTAAGEEERFDVVVSALGQLNFPRYPAWPGLDEFTGPKVHTARWEPEHNLRGKRVAVVGTGSTAAQVVPALAETAGELLVFQREPGWVVPKAERPYSDGERRALRRRWRRLYTRGRVYASTEARVFSIRLGSRTHRKREAAAREHLEASVPDAALRALVTPNHPYLCKRPVRSSTFYEALARENVRLVPKAVTRATANGLVDAEGVEHPVDAIVMATGFQPTNFLATLDVRGVDGERLHDRWNGEPKAYLGMACPGFPNFFMLYGPNTNSSTTSLIFVLERQAELIVRVLRHMRRRGATTVGVRARTASRYDRWLLARLEGTAYQAACHNYYRVPSGRVVTNWPRSSMLYWLLTLAPVGAAFAVRAERTRVRA